MKNDPDITLTLKQSSWANLFHVLSELGLGAQFQVRQKAYFEEHGVYFSHGNFWAALQSLQAQFEKETPLSTQRDYVRAARKVDK